MNPQGTREGLVPLATRRTLLGAAAAYSAGAVTPPAAAQTTDVDAIAQAALVAGRMPGMTLSVSDSSATRLARGYGFANLDNRLPVTDDTLFNVGSIGKQVTAVAILQLIEQGKIELNAPIGAYLDVPQTWRPATVLQLLHHTSGIPDYIADDFPWDRPTAHADVVRLAGDRLHFPPGVSWSYSNTGYVLLGWLIEQKSGQSLRDYLTEHIFTPLGMHRSGPDDPVSIIANRADPYDDVGEVFRHAVQMERDVAGNSGDGCVAFTAREFPIWMNQLRRPTLISAAHMRLLFTPAVLNTGRIYPWGMGWMLDNLRGSDCYAMTGEALGYISTVLWSSRTGIAVFNSTNSSAPLKPGRYLQSAAQQIMEAFAPGATPLSLSPIPDRHPELTREIGAIVARGDHPIDANRLAPELRAKIGGPLEGEIAISSQTLRSATLVEEFRWRALQVRRYRLTSSSTGYVHHMRAAYAPDGRICWVV